MAWQFAGGNGWIVRGGLDGVDAPFWLCADATWAPVPKSAYLALYPYSWSNVQIESMKADRVEFLGMDCQHVHVKSKPYTASIVGRTKGAIGEADFVWVEGAGVYGKAKVVGPTGKTIIDTGDYAPLVPVAVGYSTVAQMSEQAPPEGWVYPAV